MKKRVISILLAVCLMVSVLSVGVVQAEASTDEPKQIAQETVQGSAILHCFNWSYNTIKANLPDIAAAGYTAVQTSPVQPPKDYGASWTRVSEQWWKLYQPLDLSVADSGTWLGTKAELQAMCEEADKYGIKVIVDIVANHLANNGTSGGTYSYLHSGVASDMRNPNYYHTDNNSVDDTSRYNMTQRHLGMPDLNTANSYVQQKTLNLLKTCVDCGVDGFRFDTAKHIELPTDSVSSSFWPTVINGINSYKSGLYLYGEILGDAGTDISNYTRYMAVTDNYTGDSALANANSKNANGLHNYVYSKGASAADSLLWVESHDTYMGTSGSAGITNTASVSDDVITRAWAIVGSRADSTALFFARPGSTMGQAGGDITWKSKAVTEVNKFKNVFDGTSEYLGYSGNAAYNERGVTGMVISKLDGGGTVSLKANKLKDGTYTDHVSGSTFTVSNHIVTGTVGGSGVAVLYNDGDVEDDKTETGMIYLLPNSNWTKDSARFAAYFFGSDGDTWVSMTKTCDGTRYQVEVPAGNWTNVIFCRMNGSKTENKWDNKWNQTGDLGLSGNIGKCYAVKDDTWDKGGAWSDYTPVHKYREYWTWNGYESAEVTFTCSLCGDKQTAKAVVESEVIREATCNEGGEIRYTATAAFNGQTYTDFRNDIIPATGNHQYGEPTWRWDPGYTSATADFTCMNCGRSHSEPATVTITEQQSNCTEEGAHVYTATVSFNEQTYTTIQTEAIPATGHSYQFETTWFDEAVLRYLSGETGSGEPLGNVEVTCTNPNCPRLGGNSDYVPITADSAQLYVTPVDFKTEVCLPGQEQTAYLSGEMWYDTQSIPLSYSVTSRVRYNHRYEGQPVWEWAPDYTAATVIFTCADCGEPHMEYVSEMEIASEVTRQMICGRQDGEIIHTANVYFEGNIYTDTRIETIPMAYYHNYSEEWTWNSDHTEATLVLTCEHCREQWVLTAYQPDITVDNTVPGQISYTAKVFCEGNEYTSTDIEMITEPLIIGKTISLKDEIGVNFYLNLPADANPEAVEVSFEWNGSLHNGELKPAPNTSGLYRVTMELPARAMTDNITISVLYGGTVFYDSYRVVDYAQSAASLYADPDLKQLLCDMLDYGAAAQMQFGYHTDDLASSYIPMIDSGWTRTAAPALLPDVTNIASLTEAFGIKYIGATMTTTSKSAIRLFFEVKDEAAMDDTAVTLNGNTLALQVHPGNASLRYLEISKIAAENIFDEYPLVFANSTTGETHTYSAANYYNAVQNGDYDLSFKTVMQTMYNYSVSAKAYRR